MNTYLADSLLPSRMNVTIFGGHLSKAAGYFAKSKPMPVAGSSDWLPTLPETLRNADYEQYARVTLNSKEMHPFNLPGPISFFSSSYAIALVVLALLVNRIQVRFLSTTCAVSSELIII